MIPTTDTPEGYQINPEGNVSLLNDTELKVK